MIGIPSAAHGWRILAGNKDPKFPPTSVHGRSASTQSHPSLPTRQFFLFAGSWSAVETSMNGSYRPSRAFLQHPARFNCYLSPALTFGQVYPTLGQSQSSLPPAVGCLSAWTTRLPDLLATHAIEIQLRRSLTDTNPRPCESVP